MEIDPSLFLKRPGVDQRVLPKNPVLSSQYTLIVLINKIQIDLQINSYGVSQIIDEKKRFRPYGFRQNINLTNNQGWDIKIECDKTDESLSYLMDLQNIYSGTSPGQIAPIVSPTISIIEIIKYDINLNGEPKRREITEYKNCTIYSYDYDVRGDASVPTYSIGLFCPYRETVFDNYENERASEAVSKMIDDVLNNGSSLQ